ncbi:MAG: hypothetical protein IT223_02595 [Crocinitomicaceae bacterium]|nr:hypothetical protein [Crocinitomicaceae bacterium]
MKKTLSLILLSLVFLFARAQGTLEFNQVKIITNTLETVPSGKVWKITAMSGTASGDCVPHPDQLNYVNVWYKAPSVSGFILNGNKVYSMIKFPASGQRYNSSACATPGYCCDSNLTTYNQSSDPLVLPMWLPAGATLQSVGSGIFLSVLEFNIVP